MKIRRFALLAAAGCVLCPSPRWPSSPPTSFAAGSPAPTRFPSPARASPRRRTRANISKVGPDRQKRPIPDHLRQRRRRLLDRGRQDRLQPPALRDQESRRRAGDARRRAPRLGRRVSSTRSTITADNRALVNRNSAGNDVSGGDKPLTSNSAAGLAGPSGQPRGDGGHGRAGIQRIPGMDGQADMFSAFGLSGDQNNTTFNGLGSGVSSLPPDAQVRVTFSQFPGRSVARAGFSGAQINVQSIPGSNFSFRGLSGYGTGPDLQWTDQGADSSGQKSTTLASAGAFAARSRWTSRSTTRRTRRSGPSPTC